MRAVFRLLEVFNRGKLFKVKLIYQRRSWLLEQFWGLLRVWIHPAGGEEVVATVLVLRGLKQGHLARDVYSWVEDLRGLGPVIWRPVYVVHVFVDVFILYWHLNRKCLLNNRDMLFLKVELVLVDHLWVDMCLVPLEWLKEGLFLNSSNKWVCSFLCYFEELRFDRGSRFSLKVFLDVWGRQSSEWNFEATLLKWG
jgi:hypothetical protein